MIEKINLDKTNAWPFVEAEKILQERLFNNKKINIIWNHTLEEVGQQFSVTRERIRQIEAKALRKLKHPTRARKLKTFLDE